MSVINSIASLNLELPPSCIQFCPRNPQLFVVGTYFLHKQDADAAAAAAAATVSSDEAVSDKASSERAAESTPGHSHSAAQKRTGSLILFKLENETITRLSTTATDFAILDLQWASCAEIVGDVLAVATSTGLLAFYRVVSDAEGVGGSSLSSSSPSSWSELVLWSVKRVSEPEILVLSLTWHPKLPQVVGVTLSDGRVCLCESSSSAEGELLWSQDAVVRIVDVYQHELEAWTLAFTPDESAKVLSGGDDIVLQCSQHGALQEPAMVWRDRKLHDAGVTAILPLSDALIVTGSYDDHIRLVYTPTTGRRQTLATLNLGGGVWRLKVLYQEADEHQHHKTTGSAATDSALLGYSSTHRIVLLASCMHAGTRIVSMIRDPNGNWGFQVLAKFEEHQSMNYGSDVQPSPGSSAKTIVSTSFYDKLLCLWRTDVG